MYTSKFNKKIDFEVNLSSLNRKVISNKSKHLLDENELKKLKTFDLSYLIAEVTLKKMACKVIYYFS